MFSAEPVCPFALSSPSIPCIFLPPPFPHLLRKTPFTAASPTPVFARHLAVSAENPETRRECCLSVCPSVRTTVETMELAAIKTSGAIVVFPQEFRKLPVQEPSSFEPWSERYPEPNLPSFTRLLWNPSGVNVPIKRLKLDGTSFEAGVGFSACDATYTHTRGRV